MPHHKNVTSRKVQARTVLLLFAMQAWISPASQAQATGPEQYRDIYIDAAHSIGVIRSLQGLNFPPSPQAPPKHGTNVAEKYREMRVDYQRNQTFGTEMWFENRKPGAPGASEALPTESLFPDSSADPNLPESYRFGPVDAAMDVMESSGARVYFGISRGRWGPLDTVPDGKLYAAIVRHLIMHYNQGWAKGFTTHRISYIEVWNEPDYSFYWQATPAAYYAFYEAVARAVKQTDPSVKVGGPARAFAAGSDPYRDAFMQFCQTNQVPLDFFSWHSYTDKSFDPYDNARIGRLIRAELDAHGFTATESHVTEWAPSAWFILPSKMMTAAYRVSSLIYMQDGSIDLSTAFELEPFFSVDGQYEKSGQAFRATGSMLDTPVRLPLLGEDDKGFAVIAGKSTGGREIQILISNYELPPAASPLYANRQEYWAHSYIGLKVGQLAWDAMVPDSMLPRRDVHYSDNKGYRVTVVNPSWANSNYTLKRYRISEQDDFVLVGTEKGRGSTIRVSASLQAPAIELIRIDAH
jgi:hypothetical protein